MTPTFQPLPISDEDRAMVRKALGPRHRISAADRNALKRALEQFRRDPLRDDQIRGLAQDGMSRFACAKLAAFALQSRNMHLKPHQVPPCDANPGDGSAWGMRQKLIALGLSIYEPDPMAALQAKADQISDANKPPPAT